ncbi:MAG: cyclase family protein [Betaproteobacteria bacterium]|nr:cyclase family protein [Betaproteobacteria bacterium]
MPCAVHDHGQWPAGDQLGAGNHLTPAKRLEALALVREGALFDLSQTIEIGAPRFEPVQTPYLLLGAPNWQGGIRRRRQAGATNDAGSNLERIEMTTHVGTHIDALGHFTIGAEMYGGHDANETMTDFGLAKLGIEHAPSIVSRGLMVDVSRLDGGPFLEAGRSVGPDDIEKCLAAEKMEIRPGDIVLVHTGWGRFYMTDNPRYLSGEPGINVAAAQWLTKQGVTAIGCDNMAVEVLPGEDEPAVKMPVHQHCLVEAGVYLIENLLLTPLVDARVAEFCFILLPVKFKGATGSPARPIAMV